MKRLNTILEHINNLIVVLKPNGTVTYVSPSVKSILGFMPCDLMGDNWWKYTSFSDDYASVKNSAVSFIQDSISKKGLQYERQMKTALGGAKWMLWSSSVNADGSIVGVGSDITQRKYAELELNKRNKELSLKNKEIEESLSYAGRIQETILPSSKAYLNAFKDAFVLYKPKDIVSGDFHWIYETEKKVFVAAVDCTGHGVPGAMMSVAGSNYLRTIVKSGVEDPSKVLYRLDEEVQLAMSTNGNVVAKDGMDIALIVYDKEEGYIDFSGAFRPLILLRDGEIVEYKGARYPIGFYNDDRKHFETERIALKKNDCIYMFSDGYTDQFGGDRGKKLNKRRFKELLQTLSGMPMAEQHAFLEYQFKNWKQETEQTDDVLVIGIKF